jgi:transcriptional regulator with XRE-family HTH domain
MTRTDSPPSPRAGRHGKVTLARIIGLRLRELRTERGLTQRAVAARAGIDSTRMSKYETGEHEPPLKTLLKLSQVLAVPLDSLVREPSAGPAGLEDPRLIERFRQVEALDLGDREAAVDLLDILLGFQSYIKARQGASPPTPAPKPKRDPRLLNRFRRIEHLTGSEREAAITVLDLLLGLFRGPQGDPGYGTPHT